MKLNLSWMLIKQSIIHPTNIPEYIILSPIKTDSALQTVTK